MKKDMNRFVTFCCMSGVIGILAAIILPFPTMSDWACLLYMAVCCAPGAVVHYGVD